MKSLLKHQKQKVTNPVSVRFALMRKNFFSETGTRYIQYCSINEPVTIPCCPKKIPQIFDFITDTAETTWSIWRIFQNNLAN
jgi:hypothetical protein